MTISSDQSVTTTSAQSAIVLRHLRNRISVTTSDNRYREAILPLCTAVDKRGWLWFGQGVFPALKLFASELGITVRYKEVSVNTVKDVPALVSPFKVHAEFDRLAKPYQTYQLDSLALVDRYDRFTLAVMDEPDPENLIHMFIDYFDGPILLVTPNEHHEHFSPYRRSSRITLTSPQSIKAHDDIYSVILGYGHIPYTTDVLEGLYAERTQRAISVLDFDALIDFGLAASLTRVNARDRSEHVHFFGPTVKIDRLELDSPDVGPLIETYTSTPGPELLDYLRLTTKRT